MTDYVALRGIQAPGTTVFGYRRGDRVDESVVASWNLNVGTGPDADVAEGTDVPADTATVAVRPGPEGTRADWEAFAVAGGMSEQDAAVASQDELESAPAEAETPVRPADSAPKAEWQAYAVALGADEAWARDSATTKVNLQAYEPPVGDTVAIAATEANQG